MAGAPRKQPSIEILARLYNAKPDFMKNKSARHALLEEMSIIDATKFYSFLKKKLPRDEAEKSFKKIHGKKKFSNIIDMTDKYSRIKSTKKKIAYLTKASGDSDVDLMKIDIASDDESFGEIDWSKLASPERQVKKAQEKLTLYKQHRKEAIAEEESVESGATEPTRNPRPPSPEQSTKHETAVENVKNKINAYTRSLLLEIEAARTWHDFYGEGGRIPLDSTDALEMAEKNYNAIYPDRLPVAPEKFEQPYILKRLESLENMKISASKKTQTIPPSPETLKDAKLNHGRALVKRKIATKALQKAEKKLDLLSRAPSPVAGRTELEYLNVPELEDQIKFIEVDIDDRKKELFEEFSELVSDKPKITPKAPDSPRN